MFKKMHLLEHICSNARFTIKYSIKQGDTLSPKLFNLALKDIFIKIRMERSIPIKRRRLNYFRYVDDVVLIAQTHKLFRKLKKK